MAVDRVFVSMTVRISAGFACLALSGLGNADLASGADLARGELLYNLGGCTNCHTAKDGAELAGGDPIETPFGTFYAPNISPDPTHGIGDWSDARFLQAMQNGRDKYGIPYYPAFPYTSYTLMSDEDVLSVKAYIGTLEPSDQPSKEHELKFPFNIRYGLFAWQWWYFQPSRFEPNPDHDERWNTGAYLALGAGHCAECHTPRDIGGGLVKQHEFAGTRDGPEGKPVPNITPSEQGIGSWSASDLTLFFQIGMMPDGDFAGGDMGKIISNGTSKLPESDLQALITYLESLPPH